MSEIKGQLRPIAVDSADRFTALIIGGSGKGKTSLLRTIPNDESICVMSAESGLLCVRDLVSSGRVQGFEITSFEDVREVYMHLHDLARKDNAPQWVFIDSLTEIAARCVEFMEKEYPNAKDAIKMWGSYTKAMTWLIKSFRDMKPYNVIFTCLDEVEKNENNVRFIGPAMPGKAIKERLPSYFDEVFYLDIFHPEEGDPKRLLVTQPYNQMPAKDRSGMLKTFELPDLGAIKTKILGGE